MHFVKRANIEKKIQSLGYKLPQPNLLPKVFNNCKKYSINENKFILKTFGNLAFYPHGDLITGKVTSNENYTNNNKYISENMAKNATKQMGLNILSIVKNDIKELNKIKEIVSINGYINCDDDFVNHHYVFEGITEIYGKIFNNYDNYMINVIGCSSLPFNTPLAMDLVFVIDNNLDNDGVYTVMIELYS